VARSQALMIEIATGDSRPIGKQITGFLARDHLAPIAAV
jgi:hypothetical protein